jgi:tetratricopeptide (TPR) repeat protein
MTSRSIIRIVGVVVVSAVLFLIGLIAIYNIPAVHERLFWRVEVARGELLRLVRPQPDTLPTPQLSVTSAAPATVAAALLPSATASPEPTLPPGTATQASTEPPPPTATPLPETVVLSGVPHEYQGWNNCGPATLSMNLRFWGWEGDQLVTSAWLKPNQQDKNVRPDEMVGYVEAEAPGMQAVYRVGGSVELLQRLLAAGYPVTVGKGLWNGEQGWMGHYILVNGYDGQTQEFIVEDSLHGPDLRVAYEALDADWQSFNRVFVLVFPRERSAEVRVLLGDHAEMDSSYQAALETAQAETQNEPNNAFAWHNLGANLEYFGDHAAASAAFDQARTLGLPWRMLWYQTALFSAYYNAGRYTDVRTLANLTLESTLGVDIEESLYWRGWSKYALGDTRGAMRDFELALDFNPNYAAAEVALADLEAATPGASPAP